MHACACSTCASGPGPSVSTGRTRCAVTHSLHTGSAQSAEARGPDATLPPTRPWGEDLLPRVPSEGWRARVGVAAHLEVLVLLLRESPLRDHECAQPLAGHVPTLERGGQVTRGPGLSTALWAGPCLLPHPPIPVYAHRPEGGRGSSWSYPQDPCVCVCVRMCVAVFTCVCARGCRCIHVCTRVQVCVQARVRVTAFTCAGALHRGCWPRTPGPQAVAALAGPRTRSEGRARRVSRCSPG